MSRAVFNPAFKTAICAVALLGFAASSAPASAQDCNPLTLLFGGCQQARIAPALPSYEPLRVDPKAGSRVIALPSHARKATANAARRQIAATRAKEAPKAAKAPEAPVGSLAYFAADPTLRAGDIVVTTEGFRVYRNNRFTPIAQDGGAVAQLEKASLRPKTADITEIAPTSGEKSGLVALRRAVRVASSQ
ncbi:MAG: hypothetical protein QM651_17260 [Rhodoblastus sp.]